MPNNSRGRERRGENGSTAPRMVPTEVAAKKLPTYGDIARVNAEVKGLPKGGGSIHKGNSAFLPRASWRRP